MSLQSSLPFALATLLTALPITAQAATVSSATVTVTEQRNPGDPVIVDVTTETVPNGTATANTSGSTAVQNADGTNSVEAVATPLFSGSVLVTSTASFAQTEVNASGAPRAYSLGFSLEDLSTTLFHTRTYGTSLVNPFSDSDPSQIVDSSYTGTSFQYEIVVNGSSVYQARADLLLDGEFVSTVDPVSGRTISTYVNTTRLDNVLNFEPTVRPETIVGPFFSEDGFRLDLAKLAGTIDLGIFGEGEQIDVEATLTARSYALAFEGENGVGTRSFDPVTLSSTGILTSAPATAPVPLPAAGWLLLAGMGGIAALGRRKKG